MLGSCPCRARVSFGFHSQGCPGSRILGTAAGEDRQADEASTHWTAVAPLVPLVAVHRAVAWLGCQAGVDGVLVTDPIRVIGRARCVRRGGIAVELEGARGVDRQDRVGGDEHSRQQRHRGQGCDDFMASLLLVHDATQHVHPSFRFPNRSSRSSFPVTDAYALPGHKEPLLDSDRMDGPIRSESPPLDMLLARVNCRGPSRRLEPLRCSSVLRDRLDVSW